MNQALPDLWALQQLDTQIFELERSLARLDTGAEALRRRDEAKEAAEHAQARLQKIEADLTDVDLNIKSTEAKRKDYESRLYSGKVTNPKELEAMEQEVEMLKRNSDRLETRELELMEDQTSAREAFVSAGQVLAAAEQELKETLERSAARRGELEEQLAGARKERESQAEKVSDMDFALFRKYEGLRAKLANVAVAPVAGANCGACNIQIPGYLIRDARAKDDIVICESCGRILYPEG